MPSASALGFVGSAFSQCVQFCRPRLQPVRLALSAAPSASALGFVGRAFSQCARLCWPRLQPVHSALSAAPLAILLAWLCFCLFLFLECSYIGLYPIKPSASRVFDSHHKNGGRRTGNFSCMKHSQVFSLRTVWIKRYGITKTWDGESQGMKIGIMSVIKNLRMFRRSLKTLIPLLDPGKYSYLLLILMDACNYAF